MKKITVSIPYPTHRDISTIREATQHARRSLSLSLSASSLKLGKVMMKLGEHLNAEDKPATETTEVKE